ncbi:hypothetical protein DTO166G4_8542 [Paecilomyces variotii]|nr:hypothetical protein DTO164E3_6104 [Paecilomyces variotii]KAJ9209853.1 hypothetical protein DTO166G4_8542 [Paecilomyces variotii]KAJ9229070.1 hypothetical protein DTO166G5_8152 [Paecilomyces variotii]KAJ9296660.1 hypothetical protein DTO217A2_8771 [Paecilomyces variotii]KAJ9374266.1 hypothetical protein DTO282E5_1188 [Paecilomyces variotii]
MVPKLPTRQLGKDGPQVVALGWGAMGLSRFYGPAKPDEERLKFLDYVHSTGLTNWDTSDMYGDSEDLLGKWFAQSGKRDEIFLATKFAVTKDKDGNFILRNDPPYVKEACETSLKRMGIKTIDLYYCHRMDGVTPIEKTVQAMAELKKEGKIRYLGLSECSAETLRRACKVHHISAVQVEYSPYSLDIESPRTKLLETARELGVAIVAYSPLCRGFLGGKIRSPDDFPEDDFRKTLPRFSKENFYKNIKLLDILNGIADKKGVHVSSLTLAWLMAQGDDIIPIPGTTSVENLDINVKALSIKLTPEESTEIRAAAENAEVVGDRYGPGLGDQVFADTPPLEE